MKKSIIVLLAVFILLSVNSFGQKDSTKAKDTLTNSIPTQPSNTRMVLVSSLENFKAAMFAIGNPNDVTPNQVKAILIWMSQNLIEEKEYIKTIKKENK